MDSFLCIINRRMRMRTLAKGSQEGLLLRRPESRFASASVPSVHVVAFRIGLAQMTGRGAVSTLGALVNVQLAGAALETAATGALVGSDAQAAILTRLVADGCNQRERIGGLYNNLFPEYCTSMRCASLAGKWGIKLRSHWIPFPR